MCKNSIINSLTPEEIDEIANKIIEYDKIQFRDETASLMDLNIGEITEIAKYKGIPAYTLAYFTDNFTREEIASIINNFKEEKLTDNSIAKILNVSYFTLKRLYNAI